MLTKSPRLSLLSSPNCHPPPSPWVIITAASASISPPSLTILSHQRSPPPKSHPFRFTSTHHRTLSHSAPPKTPLAVSGNTAVSSVSPSSPNKNAKPIIVIDNYDSFTYNLCQYMGELGCEFEVYRNDELTVDDLKEKNPRGILISPGPGTPQDSGISLRTVLELGPTVPLFGVCMGLQCIGEAFGGKLLMELCVEKVLLFITTRVGNMTCSLGYRSDILLHHLSMEQLISKFVITLISPFTAGRYHSLVIEKGSFPSEALEITAWTEDGLIMAARHKLHWHLQGVQFHPESIITTEGKTIVNNFIKLIERKEAEAEAEAETKK